jgi:hypothetical protein
MKILFSTREDREKTDNEYITFYSNRRLENFVKVLVGVATTLLMGIPVIVLYLLTINGASGGLKIGILLLFVVAFAVALSILTKASRHDMFAASAA